MPSEATTRSEAIPNLERRVVGRLVRTLFSSDRRGGPWLPPAHLKHENVSFEGNTGARLAGTWFPHETPRGVVVLAHPDRRYGRHWFVRDGWIDFLQEHGYEALTFDFAGYGESRGPSTYYHEDVIAAARLARDWSGFLPVSVIGLSMGAFAAANASPKLDFVHGLVLESPYASFNAWFGQGPHRHAMRALDRLFPRTSSAIQAGTNIARGQTRRVLIALGDADEVTPPRLSLDFARAAPADRTQVLRIPGAGHLDAFTKSEAYRRAILETIAA